MTSSIKKVLLFSLLAVFANQSFSHGVWLAERTGEPTIIYGHGGHDDDYKASKVTVVKGYDGDNHPFAIQKNLTDKNVFLSIPQRITYVGFVFDNGYWTKNKAGKWKNVPKTEVKDAESGGRYIKNAISVLTESAVVKPVDGLTLQIVPLENPLTKKAGDELDIMVLFKEKPLADTKITSDYVNMSHEQGIKTDTEGKATIIIRNQGLNVIGTSYTEKLKTDPKADEIGFTSTLSFTLEHLDED